MSETFDPIERKYKIRIEYCVPCGLKDKALAVVDALLVEYQHQIDTLTLITGTGGVFEVSVNDSTIYSKAETGTTPTPEQILEKMPKG